ncbi:MAG: helix-turn-helix domain-containing protein [Thermodesulfobacteriota bacterium]
MTIYHHLKELGFTQYEISCYLTLVTHHPVNGSQLSRLSGVTRSKIYDVLKNMAHRGLVVELEGGLYAPLPPEELMQRLRTRFEANIQVLENFVKRSEQESSYEYVWTIRGYDEVLAKAGQMIETAAQEIYVRLDPAEDRSLGPRLHSAEERGLAVRCVLMGPPVRPYRVQVVHPEWDKIQAGIGGRSLDLIVDKREALVGVFETGREDDSAMNWTTNRWFIISSRDSLRHDFYHYFLYKTHDLGQELTEEERAVYELIKSEQ